MPVVSSSIASSPATRRRRGARHVAPIALRYLQRKGGKGSSNPLFFQLLMASGGTLVGARGEENLDRRAGEYHRAHVPAVRHQPRWHGEAPLAVQQRGADLRQGGHLGGIIARRLGADGPGDVPAVQSDDFARRRAVAPKRMSIPRPAGRAPGVGRGRSCRAGRQRDQTVQRTTIEERQSQRLCHQRG